MNSRDQALEHLAAAIQAVAVHDGVLETSVRGTACVRHSATSTPQDRRWRASLAIVARLDIWPIYLPPLLLLLGRYRSTQTALTLLAGQWPLIG